MLAETPDALPFLQYGALGLCGLFALGFFAWSRQVMCDHRKERAELVKILETRTQSLEQVAKSGQIALQNSTEAMRRLGEALRDRPCLQHDSRVNPAG